METWWPWRAFRSLWALNKLQLSITISAVIDIIGDCTDTTTSVFDYLCYRSLFEYPNCSVCLAFTTSIPFPISSCKSHKKDTAIALKIQSGRRAAKTLAGTIYHATAWFTVRVTYTQRCFSTHAGWNMMRVLQNRKKPSDCQRVFNSLSQYGSAILSTSSFLILIR